MKNKKIKFFLKYRHHFPLHVYLTYLLICSFLLTNISFSRFISTSTVAENARVAKGLVEVSYDYENTSITIERPSNSEVYPFKTFELEISNLTSEVAIQYDLVLNLDEMLPKGVTLIIYKNDKQLFLIQNNDDTQFVFENVGIFQANNRTIDKYSIVFMSDYTTIRDNYNRNISISIQAEQID